MSSDVQSVLTLQQSNDYGSLVIIAAVSYDYCLTFSREVTYIWKRPWTWVSVMFLLIRYGGYLSVLWQYPHARHSAGDVLLLYLAVITRLIVAHVSNYIRLVSIPNVHVDLTKFIYVEGGGVYRLGNWAYPIFWAGADLVMILRVYAMYNRSRVVLGVLLVMYVTEVVLLLVSSSIYSDPNYVTIFTVQLPVLDVAVCNVTFSTQAWNNASTISQFILGTFMCILVTAQFAKHSLQMYHTTRKWQMNRYMRLLVKDGILYFLVTLFYSLVNMLGILGTIPQGWATQVLMAATNVPLYTLTPRFVMNVRELYAHDSEGRCDRDIDTGFGLSSGAARVGGSTTLRKMSFVQGGEIGGLNDDEEIAEGRRE